MQQKIAFIVPYFGRFPEHFPFFLTTCKNNPAFTWFVFTDDNREFDYPPNVIVEKTTLKEIRQSFEQKLGFKVALEKPYKMCDFKALYGYLFSEYLIDFTHWGYCDIDLLLGNLESFLTDQDLQVYDKISVLGHLSVIKNNPEINSTFKKCDYQEILKDPNNRIFDEVRFEPNINSLMRASGYNVKLTIPYADIDMTHYSFGLFEYNGGARCAPIPRVPLIFEYSDGSIYGCEAIKGAVTRKEYAYVHFQKRKIVCDISPCKHFLLVPNRICEHQVVTPELILKNSKDSFTYYIKQHYKRICNAIRIRIKMSSCH